MIFDNIDFEGLEQAVMQDERVFCEEFARKFAGNPTKAEEVRSRLMKKLEPLRKDLMDSLRRLQAEYRAKAKEWEAEKEHLITQRREVLGKFVANCELGLDQMVEHFRALRQKHLKKEEKALVERASDAIASTTSDNREKASDKCQLDLSSLEGEEVRITMKAENMVSDFTDSFEELHDQYGAQCEEAANYLALELKEEQQ